VTVAGACTSTVKKIKFPEIPEREREKEREQNIYVVQHGQRRVFVILYL